MPYHDEECEFAADKRVKNSGPYGIVGCDTATMQPSPVHVPIASSVLGAGDFHNPTVNMTQMVRQFGIRVVIAMALSAVLWGAAAVWMPYQRELRFADRISSHGGFGYTWGYRGPRWIPSTLHNSFPVFNRVTSVHVVHQAPHMDSVVHPERITSSEWQQLLVEFGELPHLESLVLQETQIDDDHLVALSKFERLGQIILMKTNTTATGRAALRRELPHCTITPDP